MARAVARAAPYCPCYCCWKSSHVVPIDTPFRYSGRAPRPCGPAPRTTCTPPLRAAVALARKLSLLQAATSERQGRDAFYSDMDDAAAPRHASRLMPHTSDRPPQVPRLSTPNNGTLGLMHVAHARPHCTAYGLASCAIQAEYIQADTVSPAAAMQQPSSAPTCRI